MKIIWTREASENLNEIVNYLDQEWSEDISNSFLIKLKKKNRFDSKVSLIISSFRKSRNKSVRFD